MAWLLRGRTVKRMCGAPENWSDELGIFWHDQIAFNFQTYYACGVRFVAIKSVRSSFVSPVEPPDFIFEPIEDPEFIFQPFCTSGAHS